MRKQYIYSHTVLIHTMGGNSAWRKRVEAGGLAKAGSAGAIARHRPRWGRKGEDLQLNRKGNIAGGNPKSKRYKEQQRRKEIEAEVKKSSYDGPPPVTAQRNSDFASLKRILVVATGCVVTLAVLAMLAQFLSG